VKQKEASSGPCGCQAYRDLEERVDFYDKELKEMVQGAYTPTMPVIPKAVAIAIFREGLAHGAEAVATEIDNACDICIEESDYVGNFGQMRLARPSSLTASQTCVQTTSSSAVSTGWTTKKKRRMTDEYMQELERRIDNMMQRYELYRNPNDAMILDCMVRDYEAKQRLRIQDEKIQSKIPFGQG
jgi:hypothetical protein